MKNILGSFSSQSLKINKKSSKITKRGNQTYSSLQMTLKSNKRRSRYSHLNPQIGKLKLSTTFHLTKDIEIPQIVIGAGIHPLQTPMAKLKKLAVSEEAIPIAQAPTDSKIRAEPISTLKNLYLIV